MANFTSKDVLAIVKGSVRLNREKEEINLIVRLVTKVVNRACFGTGLIFEGKTLFKVDIKGEVDDGRVFHSLWCFMQPRIGPDINLMTLRNQEWVVEKISWLPEPKVYQRSS